MTEIWNKYKKLIFEFAKYIIVGGSAFVIDFATMWIFNEFVFHGTHLHISVFIGYTVGLIYNFLLSCKFVFENGFEKIKDKEVISFIIFAIIGIIGLGLTEVLMHLFAIIIGINYMISKVVTGAIVVFWNYIGRKIIIFK